MRNEPIDVVVAMAFLHHLDLAASSREIARVLKPGGRGIFKEPVRDDSQLLRALRKLIPYHAPDVSTGERPLTTAELQDFASPFRWSALRAFCLPFVILVELLPPLRRYTRSACRLDGAILKRLPAIAPLAGVRVFEVVK